MERKYTYEPEKISENSKDRMRFELGDTMVEGGADTSALADAEITAALEMWREDYEKLKKEVANGCVSVPCFGVGADGKEKQPYFHTGMMENGEAKEL